MPDLTNSESNVAAGASAAQTAAGQAAQTASDQGSSQAGAGSTYRSAGSESVDDIGQAEAYTVNMKSLVEQTQKTLNRLSRNAEDFDQRRRHNGEDFDNTLRNLSVQALQNAVTIANRVTNENAAYDNRLRKNAESHDMRVNDIAEEEIAKTPVQQDAIVAAVVSKVLEALNKAGVVKTA